MTRFYAIRKLVANDNWTKRVSSYHASVFHGVSYYVNENEDPDWRPPSASNSNREPVHISRSGRFVPNVFSGSFGLIVSDAVRERLMGIPDIEFSPVVFERLVDVAMPDVGDFSWWEQERDPQAADYESRQLNPDYNFTHLPDVPHFHQSIGSYYSLLAPNFFEVKDAYDDVEEIVLHWGDYKKPESGSSSIPISVSKNLLAKCPIFWSQAEIFSDDAFALIAPFLDLDYYAITVGHIGPRPAAPHVDAYIERLRNRSQSREP